MSGFDRQAFAKILRIRLQRAIGGAVAEPTQVTPINNVGNPTTRVRFMDAPICLMPNALEGHAGYSSIAVSGQLQGDCRLLSAALEGLPDPLFWEGLPDGRGRFVA